MTITLNGLRLALSAASVAGCARDLTNPTELEALRSRYATEWFLHWREGKLYGLPLVEKPKEAPGSARTFATDELGTLHALAARVADVLPSLFPSYPPFRRRRRGFSFLARKQETEIVSKLTSGWRDLSPLVSQFSIRPRFTLEPRIIEARAGETCIAIILDVETRWEVRAPVGQLAGAGIDLAGLAVIRRTVAPGQKALVGTISSVAGGNVHLEEAFEDLKTVADEEVWLEGSRAAFVRCLRHLLGPRYELFEAGRTTEEGKLFLGPELDRIVTEMENVLKKKGDVPLSHGLTFRVGGRIELKNTADYQSVRNCGDVEHCFDAAKSKRHPYAWKGLLKFGPFDRDTFSKRSPRILVVCPQEAAGRVSTFVKHFKTGITSFGASQYQRGFAATFGLANPTFVTASVRSLGAGEGAVAQAYRRCIDDHLASTQAAYDAAFVIIQDQHARLPDPVSPYLHAKALLLMHGVPSQQCRLSTISARESDIQWRLPNLAVALYAKLGGTPWTVAQSQTADDELVIGMGMAELSSSRFESRHRFMGITTVFRGDGNYLLSNVSKVCGYTEYPAVLRATTTGLLEELKDRNGWRPGDTVRVVFHSRKPLKNVEVAQLVGDCVREVGKGMNLEFAFLTVETSHPFRLFDSTQPGIEKRPGQGAKGSLAPPRAPSPNSAATPAS